MRNAYVVQASRLTTAARICSSVGEGIRCSPAISNVGCTPPGAAPEAGFAGIGADRRFSRRDLLHFAAPIDGILALRRRDTGRGVMLDLDTTCVPAAGEMQMLFPRVLARAASDDAQARFAAL